VLVPLDQVGASSGTPELVYRRERLMIFAVIGTLTPIRKQTLNYLNPILFVD